MTNICEGGVTFSFPDNCEASKYDGWEFYRYHYQSVAGGSKAVDILCLVDNSAWLIEVKDYRRHCRKKPGALHDEIALKVRDTLAGLAAACMNACDDREKSMARKAMKQQNWKVVLYLGTPVKPTRLNKLPFRPADVQQMLRRMLKAIDPAPWVLALEADNDDSRTVPWTIAG